MTAGGRVVAYAHGGETPGDGMTEGSVAVPDEVVWSFVPREGIGDLASDPFCRGIGRHPERYQPPALVPEDDQDEKQPKADRRHDQEIHGGNARRMVVQKGLPGLRRSSATPGHVFGDGRLSDLDPELQQFAICVESFPRRDRRATARCG